MITEMAGGLTSQILPNAGPEGRSASARVKQDAGRI
jgi:hypothetical protein